MTRSKFITGYLLIINFSNFVEGYVVRPAKVSDMNTLVDSYNWFIDSYEVPYKGIIIHYIFNTRIFEWLGCVITILMLHNCHSYVLPFENRTLKSPVFRCLVFRWLLYLANQLITCNK